MKRDTIYQKMLEERFCLYRPWIPICKSIEAEVLRNQKLTPPVLDIGCGNGLFASYYFKDKVDTGLDCDENVIKDAKKRGIHKSVEVGDGCFLPFKDNIFQTVVSVCAIEHIPSLDNLLSSVFSVLGRGGRFIFTVPSERFGSLLFGSRLLRLFGLKRLSRKYGDGKNRRSGHIHIYSPSKWKEVLKKFGFSTESIDYIFPGEAVFLWSFFHSLPFKILFLPFWLFRDLNIKAVDNILKTILSGLVSDWIKNRSHTYPSDGGYLLITARKD